MRLEGWPSGGWERSEPTADSLQLTALSTKEEFTTEVAEGSRASGELGDQTRWLRSSALIKITFRGNLDCLF